MCHYSHWLHYVYWRHAVAIIICTMTMKFATALDSSTITPTVVPAELQNWQELAGKSIVSAGQQPSCFNPLFKTHWAGKSDIRHLDSVPHIQQGLQLCTSSNARQGCCLNSFEHVLQDAFQRWVTHWQRRSQNLNNFQVQMAKIKVSQAYVKADKLQRALFDKAMSSFAPVLKWHGTCFDTLLEYMAGMLCFACDPNWGKKVFVDQDGLSVQHLHINDASNEALWQSCKNLGVAAAEMQTRVADALLAKQVWVRFEDLSMFSSKVAVSHYMAKLGLFPLRGQSENQLVLSPGGNNASGSTTARRLAAPTAFVDPVSIGRASGFQCAVFPRIPLGLVGKAYRRIPWLVLITALQPLL